MKHYTAPAKINLFLHVTGQREDGYHLLQTVFRFLDYGDTLNIDSRADGQIILHTPLPGVAPAQDLTVRAATLLQQHTDCKLGADIHLVKRLPMGGGLGGGSSDAATVLIVLNHLWGTGLSRTALEKLGLQLGADVPIFIHGHSAFAEGVGEVFYDVTLPPAWYLVLSPPVAVPTPAIFKAADLCRNTPTFAPQDWVAGEGHNDLEPVACRLFPAVAAHLAMLPATASPRMSGSGACVFAEFDNAAAAHAAAAALPAGTQAFVAAGVDFHPLNALLA